MSIVINGSGTITGATTMASQSSFATTIGVGGATPSASGAGITFPATVNLSSNANTLDDYEEGTFTPFSGITATINGGTYIKIGQLVFIQFGLQGISGATASQVTMTLPFAANYSGYQASESHFRVQTSAKLTVGQMEMTSTVGSCFYLDNSAALQTLAYNNCSFMLGAAVYYTTS